MALEKGSYNKPTQAVCQVAYDRLTAIPARDINDIRKSVKDKLSGVKKESYTLYVYEDLILGRNGKNFVVFDEKIYSGRYKFLFEAPRQREITINRGNTNERTSNISGNNVQDK